VRKNLNRRLTMRMKRTGKILITLVTVLLLMLTAACAPAVTEEEEVAEEEAVTPTPTVEWGIIEIRVTDPPPPGVETANVTLTKIEVHQASDNVSDNASGWITIIDYEVTFDLFEIIDEADILGSENVTAGKYTQIRMYVIEVAGLTTDNVSYTADVPSGKLKLIKPFEVKEGWKTILTLDFDGDKSLKMTGKSKFKFSPVIKLLIDYVEL